MAPRVGNRADSRQSAPSSALHRWNVFVIHRGMALVEEVWKTPITGWIDSFPQANLSVD